MTRPTILMPILTATAMLAAIAMLAGCQPTDQPPTDSSAVPAPRAEGEVTPEVENAAGQESPETPEAGSETPLEPDAPSGLTFEAPLDEPAESQPGAVPDQSPPPANPESEMPTEPPTDLTAEPAEEPEQQPEVERTMGPGTGPSMGAEAEPAGPTDSGPSPDWPAEPEAEKPVDLGPPLVDNPEKLSRLDPDRPVWLDTKGKRVVMVGQICQREAPLEMFACLDGTKEHEAIVTVGVKAATVHAGLLAAGAQMGHPVQFNPKYVPATGTEIEITVIWKDAQGQRKTARAQEWILDTETGKAMAHPWVFAGSGFWKDEETGEEHYQAEGGDFICVSNFSSAMLDLPIESSQANSALVFQALTERIPPLATPVTLLLTPKLDKGEQPAPEQKKEAAPPAGE
ncbi:MAG: hypothetical protein JXB62_19665 [Pirellulales bacterium]|nr:hypothetical protein [Pirellulales bacterium]